MLDGCTDICCTGLASISRLPLSVLYTHAYISSIRLSIYTCLYQLD